MRERLIELLSVTNLSIEEACCCADYLLSNGVIVLPCKVGDTVYINISNQSLDFEVTSIEVYKEEIVFIVDVGRCFWLSAIGKVVFLTKEEAEAALRKDGAE